MARKASARQAENAVKVGETYHAEDTIRVGEVIAMLNVSRSKAYEIMRQLNAELAAKGAIVVAGRISRRYLKERCFI